MLPSHGDPYAAPTYGRLHVPPPPPPLRHNYRAHHGASIPAGGPIITELTPSEYGSTVTTAPDGRSASVEREHYGYVRRLGHQRFHSTEQHSESPRDTKARSWREVNDDVAARVTAASSDSPPIIPRRDYDEHALYVDRGQHESTLKAKRTAKAEPKEPTPIVTYNSATMSRAVELYKSPNKNAELVAQQNAENVPMFQLPFGQLTHVEGMPFPPPPLLPPPPPFPPMLPYFLLPPPPPPPFGLPNGGCPPAPIVLGSPMDLELFSYGEAQRQNHLSKRCGNIGGCLQEANMFPGGPPPAPAAALPPPPPTFLPDSLCQPGAQGANGFASKLAGRYHYDPIVPSFPVTEKGKGKSDPCLLFCCKDFTQLVWLIVGIVLIGLVIGLILGLTLV
uniref:Uncharacterized protein n=1 Tax=Trichuris muris TaxID=70415 RepID=A0A5S6QZ05_TRIMR